MLKTNLLEEIISSFSQDFGVNRSNFMGISPMRRCLLTVTLEEYGGMNAYQWGKVCG